MLPTSSPPHPQRLPQPARQNARRSALASALALVFPLAKALGMARERNVAMPEWGARLAWRMLRTGVAWQGCHSRAWDLDGHGARSAPCRLVSACTWLSQTPCKRDDARDDRSPDQRPPM